jgi:hypothetical protein
MSRNEQSGLAIFYTSGGHNEDQTKAPSPFFPAMGMILVILVIRTIVAVE